MEHSQSDNTDKFQEVKEVPKIKDVKVGYSQKLSFRNFLVDYLSDISPEKSVRLYDMVQFLLSHKEIKDRVRQLLGEKEFTECMQGFEKWKGVKTHYKYWETQINELKKEKSGSAVETAIRKMFMESWKQHIQLPVLEHNLFRLLTACLQVSDIQYIRVPEGEVFQRIRLGMQLPKHQWRFGDLQENKSDIEGRSPVV